MLVSDIWPDLIELTGNTDPATNYRALALGLDWLANEKLFDPLIGYVDFTVDNGYTIALPREVKTPLLLNINNNPSFHRSRLFEFAANTDGSVDGEEVGWQWDNRGYARVQDERTLPCKLRYVVNDAADAGKTMRIRFYDDAGRYHDEDLVASDSVETATESVATIHRIESIVREATAGDGMLVNEDDEVIARYYNDETKPEYRVIKLSKTGVAIRMMFRRHAPQTFSSQADQIPFHSRLGIIWAAKTVRLLQKEQYPEAAAASELAKKFALQEQKSRDEGEEIAGATQVVGARNANINTLDSLIVADLYDEAAEIFGPIGRAKLLDKISLARDLLAKKGNWDALVGNVDIWKPDTSGVVTPRSGATGTGIFTLPRYVGSVLAVRVNSTVAYPRNGWFEFHLNGTGEQYRSDVGTWDMLGHACIIQDLARDATTRQTIPVKLAAICLDAADIGKTVRVYGLERLDDGREVEVWRDGAEGYELEAAEEIAFTEDSPNWVEIRRVKKEESVDFIKLYSAVTTLVTPAVAAVPAVPETYTLSGLTNKVGPLIDSVTFGESQMIRTVSATIFVATGFIYGTLIARDEDGNDVFTETFNALNPPGSVVVGNGNNTVTINLVDDPDAGDFGAEECIINRVLEVPEVPAQAAVYSYTSQTLLGYYYPDELEPRYARIKVHTSAAERVTVRYKARTSRLSGLHDPLHLRSPLALIEAMRAIHKRKDDPAGAQAHEADAVRFLREHEQSDHPTDVIRLQVDAGMSTGGFRNIA